MKEKYINDPTIAGLDSKSVLEPYITSKGIDILFSYDSDFGSMKTLRSYVETVCDMLNLENKWKSRLILITDELNNNAIEYGSKLGERNSMHIQVEREQSVISIFIEITDTGKGEQHKNALEMEELRKERLSTGFKNHSSIRGRGLFMIITSLVDTLNFNDSVDGGLIVQVRKRIPLL